MNAADVKEIAAKVKADRKKVLPTYADPLPYRFANGRRITDAEALSEVDQRQLVAVGVDGAGMAMLPARLLEEGPEEGFDSPEAWDVLDAKGRLAGRVWIDGTDNGTIVRGDSTEIVGGMSQGSIEITRKDSKAQGEPLIAALVAAAAAVPKAEVFKGSYLRFFR